MPNDTLDFHADIDSMIEFKRDKDGSIEIIIDNPWAGDFEQPGEMGRFDLSAEQVAKLKAWLS